MSRLLLDVLREDLGLALDDPALESMSQEYLHELLINDELFSMDVYTTGPESTPSAAPESESTSTRNIVEEIAELDLQERNLNLELSALTYKNKDIIIDVSRDLRTINGSTMKELENEINSMAVQLAPEKDISSSTSTISSTLAASLMTTLAGVSGKLLVNVSDKLYKSIESNNNILSNIDSVLDLLELPSLCKLCILQGNYQESLEISMLVQSLLIRFPGISIFQHIHQQVETELKLMVKGLVKLLNTNLKQNNILKIFQILNKLDLMTTTAAFSSPAIDNTVKKSQKDKFLKIIYLNARFRYIVSELDSLKPLIKFNKLTYLKRYIEIYREHIFNTLSIYYAIFPGSNTTTTDEDLLLINQFIRHLVTLLTNVLKIHYKDVDATAEPTAKEDQIDNLALKDGLLLQIIYLCKSLSKYNVDFESIILWELCFNEGLISESDWKRNLKKVKKFRS